KAGLVTFLVLFILVAITLGVTTYYGYDAADKAAKDKAEADKKAKAWENDANWYKYVADTYALYMGQQAPKGDDVGALRQQVGSGANAQDKPGAEHHKKIIDSLDQSKKWNDAQKKPVQTLQDEIDTLKKDVADKERAAKVAQEDQRK